MKKNIGSKLALYPTPLSVVGANILQACCIPHDLHWERRMPSHSIIFVQSGKLVFQDKGDMEEVAAGSYVFVRRDCSINVTKVPVDGEPYKGINLSLPRVDLKAYYAKVEAACRKLKNVEALQQTVNLLPHTAALESLFSSFLPYTESGEVPSEDWLHLKVSEAIMSLLAIDSRFYPTLFDFNESWKIDILDFLERNFTEDLTMEEFAAYTGRSLATFKRDFAKVSNIPPQKWIMEHRLEKARELLAENTAAAQDVGYMVGFKNRSHFSQAFKKHFGYAPSLAR